MRAILRTSVAMTACLLLSFGAQAQSPASNGPMAGQFGPPRGGGERAQVVQGIVTAAAASKIILKTDAGEIYDVSVADNTRIMENRQAIQIANVKTGDSVTAIGTIDAAKKTVQAMMLTVVDAATVARAKENMGKTYITGKLTAIDADNLKLTILRGDNVSQTIAVDDGTSFQRGTRGVSADVTAAGGLATGMGGGRGMGGMGMGGRQGGTPPPPPPPPTESITLGDIKVGDNIMATGTIKSGIFTALKMGVSDGTAEVRRRTVGAPSGPPSGSEPSGPPPPPQQ